MKNLFNIFFVLLITAATQAQTDGLTYQAVILDNDGLELPGQDLSETYLSNDDIRLKFSIYDFDGTLIYEEVQELTTDAYGMINTVIGQGDWTGGTTAFYEIDWDGMPKDLGVDVSYEDGIFEELNRQALYFVPYAYHRNITATGSLTVDGPSLLNDNLSVMGNVDVFGHTQLNSLTVFNESDLQGNLTVGGESQLEASLTVEGSTLLNNNLTVTEDANFLSNVDISLNTTIGQNLNVGNSAEIFADLNVGNNAIVEGDFSVSGTSFLQGAVRISPDMPNGIQDSYQDYPLQIEGGAHGLAIKVNGGTPGRNTNFVTFFDGNEDPVGRIEGFFTQGEVAAHIIDDIISGAGDDAEDIDPDDEDANPPPADLPASLVQELNNNYTFGQIDELLDVSNATFQFATNVVGASGLCVTGDCDDVVWSGVDLVVQLIQYSSYVTYNAINLGVAYESGGADYAEWLEKEEPHEVLTFGEVVAVKGGKISRNFKEADRFMVISKNPSVIGAMPDDYQKHKYEKVAFMGQVPVKTIGKVDLGDYILPSGNQDGLAIAVKPEEMKAMDFKRIVGVAWSASNGEDLYSYINTAVGLNNNDLAPVVEEMQMVMNKIQLSLAKIDPEFETHIFETNKILNISTSSYTVAQPIDKMVADDMNLEHVQNLEDYILLVKNYAEERNIDFGQFPYIKEVLDDPLNEQKVQKMKEHYIKVSTQLNDLKMQVIAHRNALNLH